MLFTANSKDANDSLTPQAAAQPAAQLPVQSMESPAMQPAGPMAAKTSPGLMDSRNEAEAALLRISPKITLSGPSGLDSPAAFNQTRENLLNENRYATESFAREYEQILSPCYLSPEELKGVAMDLEALKRSDLFKLGCVLFELFTSKVPFTLNSLTSYVNGEGVKRVMSGLTILPEPMRVGVAVLVEGRVWCCS